MKFQIFSANKGTDTIPTKLMTEDFCMPVTETKEITENRTTANVIWVIEIGDMTYLIDLLKQYSPDGATIFPPGAIHKNIPAIALDDNNNDDDSDQPEPQQPEPETNQDPWTPLASTN